MGRLFQQDVFKEGGWTFFFVIISNYTKFEFVYLRYINILFIFNNTHNDV